MVAAPSVSEPVRYDRSPTPASNKFCMLFNVSHLQMCHFEDSVIFWTVHAVFGEASDASKN